MEIYWLTRLSSLQTACEFGVFLVITYLAVSSVVYLLYLEDGGDRFTKMLNRLRKAFPFALTLLALSAVGCILLPTKKDVYLILGKGYVDKIVESAAER